MPLIHKGSKKAFEHNVKAEMDAHPSKERRAQNLAIAYSIKRRNTKKMAKGGMVELSAADEKRPMPDSEYADSAMNSHNSSKHALTGDDWLDNKDDAHNDASSLAKGPADHNFRDEDEAKVDNAHDETEMDMKIGYPTDPMRINEDHDEDIHDARHMADGGMIDDEGMEGADRSDSMAEAIMRKQKAKAMADGGMVDLEANSREDKNNEDDLSYNALLKEQYDDSQLGLQPMDSNEHGHILSDEDAHDMVEMVRRKLKMKRMG